MPADRFNEAETCLVENWQKARLVEKSMKAIRGRYVGICDKILESVQDEHVGLDRCKNWLKSDGVLAIGRENWQKDGNHAFIAVECLRLKQPTEDSVDRPYIGIWTGTPKKPAMDWGGISRLRYAAREILTSDQFAEFFGDPSDWEVNPSDCEYQYDAWYTLPEMKQDLTKMLLDGDGQTFVDCLVSHFEVFTKFIPVLDEVFPKPKKKSPQKGDVNVAQEDVRHIRASRRRFWPVMGYHLADDRIQNCPPSPPYAIIRSNGNPTSPANAGSLRLTTFTTESLA